MTEQDAQRVSKMIKDNKIQIIDLKFNDLLGLAARLLRGRRWWRWRRWWWSRGRCVYRRAGVL